MNKGTGLILVFALFTILMTSTYAFGQTVPNPKTLTPQDNKAKQEIIGNESDAVDHKWDRYDLIIGSLRHDNSTFTIYNKTDESPPPVVVCGPGTHEEDGKCVPDIPTCPAGQFYNQTSKECEDNPTPPGDNQTGNETKSVTTLGMMGDIVGSSNTNALDKKEYDWNVALGDMGYKSTLTDFKSNWNNLNNHRCVIGNHDSQEDGTSEITTQAKAYCGDIWIEKIANGTTVLIGVNTNGNLDVELGTAQEAVMNEQYMDGVKNVVLLTHKPCVTPPNSHHNVETNVKTLCDSLKAKTPADVKFFFVNGHNHVSAFNTNLNGFTAGSGGKSHYECGNGSGWKCNNSDWGWLEFTIDNSNGKVTSKFIKTSGGSMF